MLTYAGAMSKKVICSCPVDLDVPKRPIRFKLSVRTGNPLLWVSQNLPTNEATGHSRTVECKQMKKINGVTKRIYRK